MNNFPCSNDAPVSTLLARLSVYTTAPILLVAQTAVPCQNICSYGGLWAALANKRSRKGARARTARHGRRYRKGLHARVRSVDPPGARAALPAVCRSRPSVFDACARRWLARWLNEAHDPSVDRAAEVAGLLAELPGEPQALDGLPGMIR